MKNTIVFFVPHLARTGPINVLFSQCSCMNRSIFEPIILTLFNEGANSQIKVFESLGIPVICLKAKRLAINLNLIKLACKVEQICKQFERPIIHAHCHYPTLICRFIHIYPTIVTLHNICGEDYLFKHGKIIGKILVHIFTHSLKEINTVVAISQGMKEYYAKFANNIKVVHNGVMTTHSDVDIYVAKQKLGIDPLSKVVTVIGHINKRKNTTFIVNELRKSTENFIVFFLGDGDMKSKCINLAQGDSRFCFPGFVNNVQDYLKASDFFISASLSEGLPMAVLEAINIGVPTILSNIKPHKEIINLMNDVGMYDFELREGALISVFDKAFGERYDRNDIRSRAYSLFSAEVMQRKYESIYKSIYDN